MVVIGVTPRCNNNCIMCVWDTEKLFKSKPASEKKLQELVKSAKKGEIIGLSGGEPLLSPHAIRILEKAVSSGNEVMLLTNGRQLYYDSLARNISQFAKAKFTVAVPLNGSCAKVHDKITRSKGAFKQTVQGLRNLLRHKVRTEIRVVVTKMNLSDLPNLSLFISKNLFGVDRVVFIFPLIRGNAAKNLSIIPRYDKIKQQLEEAIDILENHKIMVRLYHFPYCTVHPCYWDSIFSSLEHYETKKLDTCGSCFYDKYCAGIPKEYLQKMGSLEFRPLDAVAEVEETDNESNPIRVINRPKFQFITSFFDTRYGIFSSSLPDIIAVKHGIKPLARLSCSNLSDFHRVRRIFAEEGIYCDCSEKKILSGRNPKLDFNDPRNGLVGADSGEAGTIYVYISKSKELVKKTKAGDPEIACTPTKKRIRQFAQALGYPKCCVSKFINSLGSSKKEVLEHLMLKENRIFLLNNLYMGLSNFYLSFHTPCSYTCEESLDYNRKILRAIREEIPNFAHQMESILKKPSLIWFDTESNMIDRAGNRFGVVFDGTFSGHTISYSGIHMFNLRTPNNPKRKSENRMLLRFKRGNSIKVYQDKIDIYFDELLVDNIRRENSLQAVPMTFADDKLKFRDTQLQSKIKNKSATFLWMSSGHERKGFFRNISISPIFLSMIKLAKQKGFEVVAQDASLYFREGDCSSRERLIQYFDKILHKVIDCSDIVVVDGPPYEILMIMEFLHYLRENCKTKRIVFTGYYVVNYPKRLVELLPLEIILLKNYSEQALLELLIPLSSSKKIGSVPNITYKPKHGKLVESEVTNNVQLKNLPLADFEDFLKIDLTRYRRISLFSARGCKFNCTYCADKTVLGKKYVEHPLTWVESQVHHLHGLYGTTDFDFRDSSFLNNKTRAKKIMLLQGKMDSGVNFSFNSRIEQIDEKIMNLMSKYRFNQVLLGIESFNKSILEAYGKKVTDYIQLRSKVRKLCELGIQPTISMIFGHPMESKKQMLHSLASLRDIIGDRKARTDHYNLEARPGTLIHDLVQKKMLRLFKISNFESTDFNSNRFRQIIEYSKHFLTKAHQMDYGLTFATYLFKNNHMTDEELVLTLDNIHHEIESINKSQ